VVKAALDDQIAGGVDDFPASFSDILLGLADLLRSGRDFFSAFQFSA
jgi:hypothetical protein